MTVRFLRMPKALVRNWLATRVRVRHFDLTRRGCDLLSRDTVSRQGGDEFVVLLSEVEQSEDASITASRMLRAVAGAHSIDQHDLHVTASIGVSVYPDDGLAADHPIKNARP